ncbi:RDD family protein [Kitasatospora sp. NBC_01287]|uniref:RDD family protein n=1 Tax=Kitasatospora sp. NBC_01287 TaxID=2903573 RepID=UPI0022554D90|nr:RDD family protein [Kitasatospora sp. NBC_01287]MCX4745055.1 RDD family protein [Kitasatospora sp. NBC_01287]
MRPLTPPGAPGPLTSSIPPGAPGPLPLPGQPIRAGVVRRGLAWLVDFALVLGAAVLLGVLTFHRIGAMLVNVPGLAGESAWQLLKSRGDYLGAGEGLGLSLWHSALSDVQQACVALALLTFLYQFGTLALTGRTLGKALLGLRVHGFGPGTSPGPTDGPLRLRRGQAAIRGAVTALADIGCVALACCALAGGAFLLAVVLWGVAVVVFWVNALPALAGDRRSLADRLAGTGVGGAEVSTGAEVPVPVVAVPVPGQRY